MTTNTDPYPELTNVELLSEVVKCCQRIEILDAEFLGAETLLSLAQSHADTAINLAEVLRRRLDNGNVTDRQILHRIGPEFAGRADG